jgi:hypothetical protein
VWRVTTAIDHFNLGWQKLPIRHVRLRLILIRIKYVICEDEEEADEHEQFDRCFVAMRIATTRRIGTPETHGSRSNVAKRPYQAVTLGIPKSTICAGSGMRALPR